MGNQPHNKTKLLILKDIFLEKTDENHCLTVPDIIKELSKYGICVERKTVYDDIQTLITYGLDVVTIKKSHSNAYYVGNRLFQDEELQVLADAVASSKFLPNKKSSELIKKLERLTSSHKAKELKRNVYIEGRAKAFNERIYYNINAIHNGINSNMKISFSYYSLDINRRKIYKNNGKPYTVSPYHLVWENDYYYLVCYCDKHQNISRYRVDRMTDVIITDIPAKIPEENEAELVKSLCSTFGMYGGEKHKIELVLDNELIPVIVDRYGSNAIIRKRTSNTFTAVIDVEISPPFWGWLFQFGNKAMILSPKSISDMAKERLLEIQKLYT